MSEYDDSFAPDNSDVDLSEFDDDFSSAEAPSFGGLRPKRAVSGVFGLSAPNPGAAPDDPISQEISLCIIRVRPRSVSIPVEEALAAKAVPVLKVRVFPAAPVPVDQAVPAEVVADPLRHHRRPAHLRVLNRLNLLVLLLRLRRRSLRRQPQLSKWRLS